MLSMWQLFRTVIQDFPVQLSSAFPPENTHNQQSLPALKIKQIIRKQKYLAEDKFGGDLSSAALLRRHILDVHYTESVSATVVIQGIRTIYKQLVFS